MFHGEFNLTLSSLSTTIVVLIHFITVIGNEMSALTSRITNIWSEIKQT